MSGSRPSHVKVHVSAQALLAMSVTLLYCSAMPLLLPLAALGFTLKYAADKTAVFRCYRKPPLYSAAMFETLDKVGFLVITVRYPICTHLIL